MKTDSPPLVLIVDDNPTNLAVLTQALADAGYDTAVATSGEGAIEQIGYEPPDLILLDVMMPPGIDGFETCDRLKKNPTTQHLPIIFMTALNDTSQKVRGFSLGAVDYITKPFQQEEVLARVKVHVQVQQLTQTLEAQNRQLKALTDNLETTVEKRTAQLRQAQVRLIQQEKLSMLGQLVAGVAHEINNPLSCLTGNLNPAKDYVADLVHILELYQQHYPEAAPEIEAAIAAADLPFILSDLPALLNSMQLGAERIRDISTSLRNFTRADTASRVVADLHQGLESTLLILQHRLKANGDRPAIAIHKNYGDIPAVECYPGPINQVFMNLIANAIDAFEDKAAIQANPEIQITTLPHLDQWVEVRIRDNGPGIDAAIRDRIFDPQFTTKPVNKGTGLGLSISQQIIVEQHGGRILCDSAPGQGTTFILQLPMQAPIPTSALVNA